jgi:hypothetical protein
MRRKILLITCVTCAIGVVVGVVYAASFGVYVTGTPGYLPVEGLAVGTNPIYSAGQNIVRFTDTESLSAIKFAGQGRIDFNISQTEPGWVDGIWFCGGNDTINFGTGADSIWFGDDTNTDHIYCQSGDFEIAFGVYNDADGRIFYDDTYKDVQIRAGENDTSGGSAITVEGTGDVVITLGGS